MTVVLGRQHSDEGNKFGAYRKMQTAHTRSQVPSMNTSKPPHGSVRSSQIPHGSLVTKLLSFRTSLNLLIIVFSVSIKRSPSESLAPSLPLSAAYSCFRM